MPVTLNEVQQRVLGVLLEKALAQPQYYPMSANAILAACNQKSNRDPVLNLDEETVWNALEVLRAGGLVSRLLPGGASRVERFRHEAKEYFGWEKPQRAVMAELLLRGPQTIGELRTHCQRMYPFENLEAVAAVLEALGQSDSPLLSPLPRTPGQSAIRYAHRLCDDAAWGRLAGAPTDGVAAGNAASDRPTAPTAHAARSDELAGLRAEVAELRQHLGELRQRVERLERPSGSV